MAKYLEAIFSRSAAGKGKRGAFIALCAIIIAAVLLLIFNFGTVVEDIGEMGAFLQYKFIQRALVVGVLVALCAALLGVTLVLKRYSMIGDGLSHVGFGALSIAAALGFVTAESLPAFLSPGVRSGIADICAAVSETPNQPGIIVTPTPQPAAPTQIILPALTPQPTATPQMIIITTPAP